MVCERISSVGIDELIFSDDNTNSQQYLKIKKKEEGIWNNVENLGIIHTIKFYQLYVDVLYNITAWKLYKFWHNPQY